MFRTSFVLRASTIGFLLAMLLWIALISGCASTMMEPAGRPIYVGGGQGHSGYVLLQSQFSSRLEFLRFCDRYWMHTKMCVD